MPLINVDVPKRYPHSWEYFTRNGADGPWDSTFSCPLSLRLHLLKLGTYIYNVGARLRQGVNGIGWWPPTLSTIDQT